MADPRNEPRLRSLLAELHGQRRQLSTLRSRLGDTLQGLRSTIRSFPELDRLHNSGRAVIDDGGIVRSVDVAAARVLGVLPSDAVGRPLGDFFAVEDRPPWELLLERLASRSDASRGLRVRGLDRSILFQFWVRAEPGAPAAATTFEVLISRLEELGGLRERLAEAEARLERANADLDRRWRQLQRVAGQLARAERHERERLSSVLHDHVQQILVAARMRLEPIRLGRSPDPAARATEVGTTIEEAIAALRSLAADLNPPGLDEAGLDAALAWLARRMEQTHGLTVELRADPELPALPQDLRIVLFQGVRELLFNVVKHAGVDRAFVTAGVRSDGRLRVAVRDHGAGFDADGVELGLGLETLRERVAVWDGELQVRGRPGEGTTVTLLVPPPVAETDRAAENDPDALRVLVVDDHPIVREGLVGVIGGVRGLRVVAQAGDGESAIARALETEPDVVLMDLRMPGMTGLEATERLKQRLPGTYVVALSMSDDPATEAAARTAGADEFVSKAADIGELLARVRARLRGEPPAGGQASAG